MIVWSGDKLNALLFVVMLVRITHLPAHSSVHVLLIIINLESLYWYSNSYIVNIQQKHQVITGQSSAGKKVEITAPKLPGADFTIMTDMWLLGSSPQPAT